MPNVAIGKTKCLRSSHWKAINRIVLGTLWRLRECFFICNLIYSHLCFYSDFRSSSCRSMVGNLPYLQTSLPLDCRIYSLSSGYKRQVEKVNVRYSNFDPFWITSNLETVKIRVDSIGLAFNASEFTLTCLRFGLHWTSFIQDTVT